MVTNRDRSVVAWVAVIGAVSAPEVMDRPLRCRADGRLPALGGSSTMRCSRRRGSSTASRRYNTATTDGLAWVGMPQLRVGVATTRHWAACARLAVQLERAECCEVWGEPRLKAAELEAGHAIASAVLGTCRTDDPGCGGRISCCFLVRRCRWRSRWSCRARDPQAGGDLPRVGAVPDRQRGPLLRPATRRHAVSRAVSSVRAHDAVRILPLDEPKEVHVVRFAA